MKKVLIVFSILIIMLVNITVVFAGDIPETLMSSDDAQIFYGKLVKVDLFGNEGDTTVIPVKKIKGTVILEKEKTYKGCTFVGEFSPNQGNVYVFAYINEDNPIYIFEANSYDTKTVQLTGVSGDDMWKRFENYLHEGKYEEAEKERQGRISYAEEETEVSELPPLKNHNSVIYAVISMAIAVVAFFVYTKVSKKRI